MSALTSEIQSIVYQSHVDSVLRSSQRESEMHLNTVEYCKQVLSNMKYCDDLAHAEQIWRRQCDYTAKYCEDT